MKFNFLTVLPMLLAIMVGYMGYKLYSGNYVYIPQIAVEEGLLYDPVRQVWIRLENEPPR